MELFLNDGYQHIHRQSDPDLCKDRVFGGAVERFESQMLFEPAEEEFHLPAAAIQFGYSNCDVSQVKNFPGTVVIKNPFYKGGVQ